MPLETKYLDLIASVLPETDEAARERLSLLYDRVVLTNEKINITSLTSPIDVTLKHILDSLSLFSLPEFARGVSSGSAVCDMGCGGGFPGLPIACLEPGLSVTMIDSTEKKITALQENATALGLPSVHPVWGRGEELAGPRGAHRERYDICVSRAVARLSVLCELCLPTVKKGGLFVAMKGARAEEELEEAKRAIPMLGGALKEIREILLPEDFGKNGDFSAEEQEKIWEFSSAKRYLIVIEKKKNTQSVYPRKWAQMTKKPL